MLDINFFRLIAREREIEPGQKARLQPGSQLLFVKEIRGALLVSEEKPVLASGAHTLSFFEKGAKRRNACAGTDHDHRRVARGRWFEATRRLDEDIYEGR